MPQLIQDTTNPAGSTGNKNAAIIGSHLFNNDGIVHKQFSDIHYVRGDTPYDTEDGILSTIGLIQLGQYVRGGWCVNRSARCIDDTARVWEVRYEFTSDASTRIQEAWFNDGGTFRLKRPDEMMPVMRWSTELVTEPLLFDQETIETEPTDPMVGELKMIKNTVGEPMFPETFRGITVLELDQYIIAQYASNRRARKYVSTLNDAGPEKVDQWGNQLGMEWFFGAPHACCWCGSIRMQEVGLIPMYTDIMPIDPNNGVELLQPYFVRETIQFKFRWWYDYDCDNNAVLPNRYKRGWILRLVNQGNFMKQKKEADETQYEDKPAAGPDQAPGRRNLDLEGYPLEWNEPPVWLDFNRYPIRKFAPFTTDTPPYDTYEKEVLVQVKPPEPEIDPDPADPNNQDFPPIQTTPTPGVPCP